MQHASKPWLVEALEPEDRERVALLYSDVLDAVGGPVGREARIRILMSLVKDAAGHRLDSFVSRERALTAALRSSQGQPSTAQERRPAGPGSAATLGRA